MKETWREREREKERERGEELVHVTDRGRSIITWLCEKVLCV